MADKADLRQSQRPKADGAARDGMDSVEVLETGATRSLRFAGSPALQSRMSLLQPDALDLQYTRMMMGFLLFAPLPRDMLMIGLGGGSLAKFCHRYLPTANITVVEIDPAVIALREHFLVPPDGPRLRVVQGDGADYVAAHQEVADVLLIDGYDQAGLPAQLATPAFYRDCRAVLRPDGMLSVNLHLEALHHALCLQGLLAAFPEGLVEALDDDMTNSIVLARNGAWPPLDDLGALRRPEGLARDAWRQLMPTLQVIAATLTLR